jgi:hypothetical protein
MPDERERGDHPLDVLGLALLSPGLAAVVYGLTQAGTRGGFTGAGVVLPIVVGLALLAGFVMHALRAFRCTQRMYEVGV